MNRVLRGAAAVLWVAINLSAARGAEATGERQNELRIGRLPVNRVLVLGNSIALHGPAPQIGWQGNWGMAASARDKDFAHLLAARLAAAAGGTPELNVRNIADFERQHATFDLEQGLEAELAFRPELVIVAIGENVPALASDQARSTFRAAVDRLLALLAGHGAPTVIVRSTFWPDAAKDGVLKGAAEQAGAVFVDIGPLGKDPANQARSERKFEHAGVAAHPGDRGMQAIAEALWLAIEARAGQP